jgi:hypothetical protein
MMRPPRGAALPSFASLRVAPLAVGALVLVSLSMVGRPAAADIRVWSDTPAPAEGEAAPATPRAPERFLDLTAFAQPGFIVRMDDPNAGRTDDSFWLQRARFGFNAQLFSWLRFRFELETAPVASLQDAFLEISPHSAFRIRAGQFLIPLVRAYAFNELNLGFLDRPYYIPISPDRSFIRYLNPRDVGLMVHGIVGNPSPESTDPAFQYEVGLFNGRGPNFAQNDDEILLAALRLQLHILGVPRGVEAESDLARNTTPRVAVATSFYSNCDDRRNWNRGFVVDTELRWEGLYASAGFVWFRNSQAPSTAGGSFSFDNLFANADACPGQAGGDGQPLDFVSRGAHLQVQYVLHRDLFPVDGMNLELLARIDWADGNSPYDPSNPLFGGGEGSPGYVEPVNFTDSDNPPTRWRLTFGINWFPSGQQSLRLGINYQHQREAESVRLSSGFVEAISNDIFWTQITAGI